MKAHVVSTAKSHRKRIVARTLITCMATGAVAFGVLAAGTQSGDEGSGPAVSVADEGPGYAVEDFNYPGADRILEERGIVLKRGDGHITLADCASGTDLIQVMARRAGDPICFRTVGTSGWLTMEIPAVYLVRGNDYATQVDMTVGDEEKSFDIEKNTWTAVGESADEQGREHLLVEIRTTK
ncbi:MULTISPECIES: hypothetical protein [Streptomyces]|uniref:Secreted protein n=1 Tax=Streptomyces lienomycini TaxID=284035 RepID=A0ABV9WRU9_9ACTN|nr:MULTISPECIES: hypothetical protein [Streptomyces]